MKYLYASYSASNVGRIHLFENDHYIGPLYAAVANTMIQSEMHIAYHGGKVTAYSEVKHYFIQLSVKDFHTYETNIIYLVK
jgi:hypothetical protein